MEKILHIVVKIDKVHKVSQDTVDKFLFLCYAMGSGIFAALCYEPPDIFISGGSIGKIIIISGMKSLSEI